MSTAPRAARANRFILLVYRMPAKPTAGRVAVWRQLKKIGAIYLQQSVCVFPARPDVRRDLAPILQRIVDSAGEFYLLSPREGDAARETKPSQQFLGQTSDQYRGV